MDLSRIALIRNSNKDELNNVKYVENLIFNLGLNNECPHELPQKILDNNGGLLIWQYPNQFSKYLLLLNTLKIKSYLEIGCRFGGTCVLTLEYLNKFNFIEKGVAVDIIDSSIINYKSYNNNFDFYKYDSQKNDFSNFIKNNFFDLIFIDGDHSYDGVRKDFLVCKNNGKIFVFHDIINDACPGVIKFWNELKEDSNNYDFYEYVEQYNEVYKKTGKKFLGIGVAIKKI